MSLKQYKLYNQYSWIKKGKQDRYRHKNIILKHRLDHFSQTALSSYDMR